MILGPGRSESDQASTSGSSRRRDSTVHRRGGGRDQRAGQGQRGGRGFGLLPPGNLLVSESFYSNDPNIVAGQTQLPPGCTAGNCVTATANGSYPQVFNNALVDGSFGVTSRIFLAEMTPSGLPLGTIAVPPSELVTSFSSKSELAPQPLPRRPHRVVHGLRGRAGRRGRLELQHAGGDRPDQPGARRLLPGGGAAVRRRAAWRSPRPTPTAATTAGRRSPPTPGARSSSTPRATPGTAATRSRTASSSARARS